MEFARSRDFPKFIVPIEYHPKFNIILISVLNEIILKKKRLFKKIYLSQYWNA